MQTNWCQSPPKLSLSLDCRNYSIFYFFFFFLGSLLYLFNPNFQLSSHGLPTLLQNNSYFIPLIFNLITLCLYRFIFSIFSNLVNQFKFQSLVTLVQSSFTVSHNILPFIRESRKLINQIRQFTWIEIETHLDFYIKSFQIILWFMDLTV